ncbi:hypothetical protein FE810_03035 [Thalassotalea litorea]|uniref:Uncharacterized protein n=1 Tax=Thalassotalea litorea TaxID=2020715 RepID=A0A5R9IS14_9GAMM|nr:hypothetical protein [Thalassotalea litorea]TLU67273.1 hypothetical protein FE810_03035 [Thalassotalea litorea]
MISLFLLSACIEPLEEQINHQLPISEQKLGQLRQALHNGEVANARVLKDYAQQLGAQSPEQQKLITLLVKNATPKGQMFRALNERLQAVKYQAEMFDSQEARYQELLNIYQAADPKLFSDALSDPLNVLADLSAGELARVNAETKNQTLQINQAKDLGIAALLVGHPAFGQWQPSKSEKIIWVWFKNSREFDSHLNTPPITYQFWAQNRDYSYYADIGRGLYTALFIRAKQDRMESKLSEKGAFVQQRQGDSDLSAASLVLKSSYN